MSYAQKGDAWSLLRMTAVAKYTTGTAAVMS